MILQRLMQALDGHTVQFYGIIKFGFPSSSGAFIMPFPHHARNPHRMSNPFDLTFVYPLLTGAISLFLIANDLFAGISAIFSIIILLVALFERVMTYGTSRAPLGPSILSISFLIIATAGQAMIYLSGQWPETMGVMHRSPMITVIFLILSAVALLLAEVIRS
jgi:hypothetical protein